jgi:KDO2-lipid IV(A) lauroyltransferase
VSANGQGSARIGARLLEGVGAKLRSALRQDSAFWRRAMVAGVSHGPEPWLRYSPPVFGWAFGAALRDERRAVRNSLRLVHGRRPAVVEMRDVAEVFANFASSMTDAMLVGTGRGYQAVTRPINESYMVGSVADGKGVIVATAQTAGWDVAGTLLHNDMRTEVLVVMEREPNAVARQLHDAMRNRDGVRVVHVGADPLSSLPLLRHLQNGGVVALKFDRVHPGMRTLPVTFFGRQWQIPAGPLKLAALSGAPIVPSFTRRLGFLDYQAINCKPIYVDRRASHAAQVAAAQRMASNLEDFVREHPTHWIRFHE